MADDATAVAAAKAEGLPCWAELGEVTLAATSDEAVSAELELGSGRTNQNFIATRKDGAKRYFVRIGQDIPAYGVTRAKEQAAGRAAADAGIAPQVLYTAPDAMVTEFSDGRTLTDAQLKAACAAGPDNELLVEVVVAVRKLHATPAPSELAPAAGGGAGTESRWAPSDSECLPTLQHASTPRCRCQCTRRPFSFPAHCALLTLRWYSRRSAVWGWLALAEEQGYDRLPLLAEARSLVATLEAVAGEPSDDCFCHYDLLPDNLIRQPSGGGVCVIDFEYAGIGQRLMDLAIMSMGCSLGPEEEKNLLTAYTGSPASAELLRGFSALKVLACLRETLWGVTAEVSGASALPMAEAISYADENYEKLTTYRAAFEQAESELQQAKQ